MRLHRLALSATTPLERGLEYAAAAGTSIGRAAGGYRQYYLRLGADPAELERSARETLDLLSDWSPEQADEIRGIARGTGLPESQVTALVARTEILSTLPEEATECSTVVVLPAVGTPRSVQTWDWLPQLAPDGVLLEYTSAAGIRVSTFTEYGMTAKIGVNSAGLGSHFNILRHATDGQAVGVPVHCLVREVLSRATTLDEAVEIVRSAPAAASSVFCVLTADDAAAVEVSPRGVAVVPPTVVGDDRVLWHTNHFLDPTLAEGEAGPATSTTHVRADHLTGQLDRLSAAGPGLADLAAAMCGPAGGTAPVCVTPGPGDPAPWTTLLTAGITLAPPRLELHAGIPATVPAGPELGASPCTG